MLTIRAMSNGAGYSGPASRAQRLLCEGRRVVAGQGGVAAELLGLSANVQTEQFEALREGRDPATGQFLRQRRADRLPPTEHTKPRKESGDFTFSAPKSVSIMAPKSG